MKKFSLLEPLGFAKDCADIETRSDIGCHLPTPHEVIRLKRGL